jgi:hypothetical protein
VSGNFSAYHYGMNLSAPCTLPDNEQAPTPCWQKSQAPLPLVSLVERRPTSKRRWSAPASVGQFPLCFTVLLLTLCVDVVSSSMCMHVRLALTTASTLCDALPRLRATAWLATSRIALDRRRLPVLLQLAEEMIGRMTSSTAQWPWTAR